MNQNAKGFTLLELLIAIVIVAILSPIVYGWVSIANRDKAIAYHRQVFVDHVQIADGFRLWASQENKGFLPNPYTNMATKDVLAPIDLLSAEPKMVSLRNYLARGTLSLNSVNSDGTSANNAKVYQKLTGLVYSQPVEGVSQLAVNLQYERGVIYQTQCSKQESCNTGLVGASPLYSETWEAVSPDIKPVEFSTLDIQQEKWAMTWGKIKELKQRFREAFTYSQLSAQAGDLTNFFYKPATGETDVGQLHCASGWFDLSTSDVLQHYGISPKEVFGQTSWGGAIDYCPDYDPQGQGADKPPHNAALRLNINVTQGVAPNNTGSDNLIIII
ncbi:prepilin-type N-terminal cleavage/methylation domain-containing protein [Vibrio vulnificus]|uniref:type II secretion system protein n=1 Tax=Vibrio vulnificus TaxID=672 RepID=UPI004058A1CF